MNKLQQFIQSKPMGFMDSGGVSELVKLDRLFPVLARCGGGRFTCAVQDVEHFIKCVSAGGDYVRDVCLPVGSLERAADWSPEPLAEVKFRAVNTKAAGLVGQVPDRRRSSAHWDEAQCGGVFDGHQVTSDADSGL